MRHESERWLQLDQEPPPQEIPQDIRLLSHELDQKDITAVKLLLVLQISSLWVRMHQSVSAASISGQAFHLAANAAQILL